MSDMSPSDAIRWLSAGAARACDAIGNRGPRRAWNTRDVEAVHVLERRALIHTPDGIPEGWFVSVAEDGAPLIGRCDA